MRPSTLRLCGVLVSLVAAAVASAAEPAIIAKARAYLGSEAALDRIQTLRYSGSVAVTVGEDTSKPTNATVEIILQRPDRQRVTIKSEGAIEVTALDGYDAWTRVTQISDPTKWSQTLLSADHIKRLRANTWENLAFYRGLERIGGQIRDMGTATIDGVSCQKVAFIHRPNIIFYRYFDLATGRVIYSETEGGVTIREKGELVADGVRFPRSIVTVQKEADGQTKTVTITFDQVTVNETFAPNLFTVPSLAKN